MKSIFVLISIVALCGVRSVLSVDPPNIPETFSATYDDEIHEGEDAFFGVGYMARDQNANMYVENTTATSGKGEGALYYELERYDQNVAYVIRGEAVCYSEPVTGSLPSFWDWLDCATYAGNQTVQHHMLEMWTLDVASVHFELGMDYLYKIPVPVLLRTRAPQWERVRTFRTFTPKSPPSTDFDVPLECV